jgi:hypothetical protein
MSITVAGSGTKTVSSVGTAETLQDINTAGVYTLVVNTVNMAAGDILELRVYQMVLTATTRRVVAYGMWADVQPADDYVKKSIPFDNELTDTGALRFELNQLRGSAKGFDWKVLKHA